MLIIKSCKSYRKRLLGLAYDFVRIPRLPRIVPICVLTAPQSRFVACFLLADALYHSKNPATAMIKSPKALRKG